MNWSDFFEYRDGSLFWIIKPSKKVRCGSKAGYVESDGYVRVRVLGKPYQAHRVIWEMIKGKIPDGMQIDHLNHIRDDNRIENLRLVTHKENHKNKKIYSTNTSGACGVSWCKSNLKWHAQIKSDNKTINIGYFNCIELAIEARIAMEQQSGFHKNHGE